MSSPDIGNTDKEHNNSYNRGSKGTRSVATSKNGRGKVAGRVAVAAVVKETILTLPIGLCNNS